jgi:ADP-ribosylglycohydrolase
MHDRAVGTLIGSAIGDAVGLYTEFLTAEKSIREYPSRTFSLLPNATPFARDMHRLKHNPGEWTDDTDHALLILLSFMHSNQLDPKDVASRLRTWVEMGLRARDSLPLGLGATVGAIVRNPKYLEDPVGTAHAHWVKFGHNAAANGSLMRTHPLGVICVHRSWDETFEIAARFSAITHVDPRCVTACMVGTALIRGLITGEVRNEQHVDELINAAINDFNNRITPMFRKEGPFTDADPGLDIEEVGICPCCEWFSIQ